MKRLILTALLMSSCGNGSSSGTFVPEGGSTSKTVKQGISKPKPTVILTNRGDLRLQVSSPTEGHLLQVMRDGSIVLRGEVIAIDRAVAKAIEARYGELAGK